MNNPKISVIVPIYNAEKYLKKCLDSIVNQTYRNLEIILVNDGSTDSSKDIILKYESKDSRIITIHKENGGIGSALEAAFKKMTSEYVSFVDSDDYISLEMYAELVEIIQNEKPDIIQFGMYRFNETGNIYKTEIPEQTIMTGNQSIVLEHFTKIKTPSLACRIFRSELFNKVKLPHQNLGIDEITYIQIITKCQSYRTINKAYYHVYHRQESVSRATYTSERILEGIMVHQFIIKHINENKECFINYTYIKYIKYIILVGLELVKEVNIENNKMYELIINEFNKFYNLIVGSNEEKNEKLSFRITCRIFKFNPRIYYKMKMLFINIKLKLNV